MEWLTSPWSTVGIIVLKAVVVYAAIIVFTRISGLRSFAKMSSFDFAVTVAFGSILASAVLSRQPALAQVLVALFALYLLQALVALLRRRTEWAGAVDNEPLVLMAGTEILEENMKTAMVTPDDLAAKLRESNVIALDEVRAVILETTGDISVLHGEPGGPELDDFVLSGVRDAHRVLG